MLLDAMDSPILSVPLIDLLDPKHKYAKDIRIAAIICSKTYAEGIAVMDKPESLETIVEGIKGQAYNAEQEAYNLIEYLRYYTAKPLRYDSKTACKRYFPAALHCAAILMSHYHLPQVEAWATSLPYASSLMAIYAKSQGDDDIVPDEDIPLIEQLSREAELQEAREGKTNT
jgi:hypothetical protein